MSLQADSRTMSDRHRRLQHAMATLKAHHAVVLITERRCPVCEELFAPRRGGGQPQRYCSRRCHQRAVREGRRR